MRIELKGLLIAVVAALVVLGATFGVSALVRRGQSLPVSEHPAPAGGATSGATMAAVTQGHQFYTQSCASCHGANAKGGYGPNLYNEDMSDTQIAGVIQNGVKNRMPAFRAKYGDAQTQALIVYIRTLK